MQKGSRVRPEAHCKTGSPPLRKDGDIVRKRKNPGKKQRRDNLTKIHLFAAALYWLVRLILMLWDRSTG